MFVCFIKYVEEEYRWSARDLQKLYSKRKIWKTKRECLQNVQLDDMHNHDSTIKLQGQSNSWNQLYW